MPLFASSKSIEDPFTKNEAVRATLDLPGVPQGTTGKVKLVNGFSWTRYWVFFENGVDLGQLDENEIVRPRHWDEYFERKSAAEAASAAADLDSASEQDEASEGSEISTDPSTDPLARIRALVPAHLLERSREARTRLGA